MDRSRFTDSAGALVLKAISDAGGREVLVVGKLDEEGMVCEITVAARGSSRAVPALLPYMQKGDVVIHNHPSGKTEPSAADLQVASGLGNQGIGFYIIDNDLGGVYVVAEAIRPPERVLLDKEKTASFLLPGGALSKAVDYYEPRDSQIRMLESVVDAFNDDSIVVVEAGTGVGKSLAYLIPAFEWVQANEERVVVSTATINLQQQLVESDIPLVRRITGTNVKVHLAKGRRNYLCLRRLQEALEENSLFAEEDEGLEAIRKWAESTPTGGKEDLAFFPSESLWGRVCSEADSCLGLRCSRRGDCFVLKARREAASSQILIVNHHLLFSDQAVRASGAGYDAAAVLPPFEKIIFDEAHNLERSATSFFSESLSRFSVNRTLTGLHRTRRGSPAGLIHSLRGITTRHDILDSMPQMISAAQDRLAELDVAGRSPDGSTTTRFSSETAGPWHSSVVESLSEMEGSLGSLVNALYKIVDDYRDEEEPELIVAAKGALRRLERFCLFCRAFAEYPEYPDRVFWTERRKTGAGELFTAFNSAPVDIAGIMRETVFAHYDTLVCTSATLSVGGDFSFWSRRIGLDAGNQTPAEGGAGALFGEESGPRNVDAIDTESGGVTEMTNYANTRATIDAGNDEFADKPVEYFCLPSPFPYAQNVLLAAPADGPPPTDSEYGQYVASFVRDAIEISEGGALVLFTSYKMLSEVYDSVASELGKMGVSVLRQGAEDRLRLLRRFSTENKCVLFATASFWEGVDAPGESLRLLIICRLPFQVPSDPIVQARYERIVMRNGNPFLELSLPAAITRLKQGFGRLMRRATDRGVVLIRDSRILKKQYGGLFIDSLPETRRCFSTKETILDSIERMLYDA